MVLSYNGPRVKMGKEESPTRNTEGETSNAVQSEEARHERSRLCDFLL